MSEQTTYKVGAFTFTSYYEYRAAMEDVRRIESINSELDIQNPEVAIRLYNDIKDGIITFGSPVGEEFASHVADIVANKSKGLLSANEIIQGAEKEANKQRLLGGIFIAAAVVVLLIYAAVEIEDKISTRRLAQLASSMNTTVSGNVNKPIDSASSQPVSQLNQGLIDEYMNGGVESGTVTIGPWDAYIDVNGLSISEAMAPLYASNSDVVGWLTIENTDINYPVMQTIDDPQYYLTKSFDKKEDSAGSIFMDYRCDPVNSSTNTIIYGHNMKNGTMFGSLKKYLDKSYVEQHKSIIFRNLYDEREYEIIMVGLSAVGYSDGDGYKYYDFINADEPADLGEFIDNTASMAVYQGDLSVTKHDRLLTLSTCNGYTEDGRLFIVAKRVR